MSNQQISLVLSFSRQPAPSSARRLILQQEEWSEYAGKMTKMQMVRMLFVRLFGSDETLSGGQIVDCPIGADGRAAIVVHAYPDTRELEYSLISSHGEVGGGKPNLHVTEDTLHFDISSSADVGVFVSGIASFEWLTCYSPVGEKITGPTPTASGTEIILPYEVYGSLKLSYTAFRFTHIIDMEARADAIEHFWSAWVLGLVPGSRPEMLELDAPPTAEELSASGLTTCPTANFNMVWDEDNATPEVIAGRKEQVFDYCTDELLREF